MADNIRDAVFNPIFPLEVFSIYLMIYDVLDAYIFIFFYFAVLVYFWHPQSEIYGIYIVELRVH